MALDSYRSMNQLKAETLDPTLLSWLKKDFKTEFKEKKEKVFNQEVLIGEKRSNAWLTVPMTADDTEIALKSELESYHSNMLALDEMLRELITLD